MPYDTSTIPTVTKRNARQLLTRSEALTKFGVSNTKFLSVAEENGIDPVARLKKEGERGAPAYLYEAKVLTAAFKNA